MAKVRVFNGYVKDAFPAKHQSHDTMVRWMTELRKAVPDLVTFYDPLDECWAWKMVQASPRPVYSADHPNEPADRYATPLDAVKSQCVLHQRFKWADRMAEMFPEDTLVWLEPTIFKQRGINEHHIHSFLDDIEYLPFDAISLPGIWEKQPILSHVNPWRFAGSTFVCPAKYAHHAYEAARWITALRMDLTDRICWDNATWAYLELLNVLPIRWYPGNHDETQLTGYRMLT